MINNNTTCGEWKIHSAMITNFTSFKDFNETGTMHTKCDNIEVLAGDETGENIEEGFDSLL